MNQRESFAITLDNAGRKSKCKTQCHNSLVSRDVQVHTQIQSYAPCSVSQVFSCDQTDATLHGVPQGNTILLQDPFTFVHQEVSYLSTFFLYTIIYTDTDTLDIARMQWILRG